MGGGIAQSAEGVLDSELPFTDLGFHVLRFVNYHKGVFVAL